MEAFASRLAAITTSGKKLLVTKASRLEAIACPIAEAAQQSASHADLKGRVEAEVQRLETCLGPTFLLMWSDVGWLARAQ